MTIDREAIKSEYLQWENGKTARIQILHDPVKEMKERADGKGKYPLWTLRVKRVGLEDAEVKKLSLFRKHYRSMVKAADKKAGTKVSTLVGCVFDYTKTVIEREGKDDEWNTKLELVSSPVEEVRED